ncbi:MAG: response regulator [Leptolyngbyaceae cyanobacterium CSU_1_3]|nr:response regulator [Leptolyngbyaceae cyanobacterium CSU_1_3]
MSPASGLHPAQLEAAGATDFSRTLPPEIAPYATPNAALAAGSAQSAAPPQEVILAGHGKHGRLAGDGPMPKRVLMVDDDITARHYMRSRLMLRGNVSIFEASSVAQGMALLQSQPHFDAALLDVDMGVQNGYELCKAIRAWVRSQGGKQPTIYIITSRTSMIDKMRAKMAGADEFLSKPPSPKATPSSTTPPTPNPNGAKTSSPKLLPSQQLPFLPNSPFPGSPGCCCLP